MSRFILLQGPSSPFFRYLKQSLEARGHEVLKVNFNGGDDLYYSSGNIIRYRDTAAEWPAFFRELIAKNPCAGVVAYGDCRWMHRAAKEICREAGVGFFALEEGYLRPDWVTIEREGVNAFSRLREEFIARDSGNVRSMREANPAKWPDVLNPVGRTLLRRVILFASYDLAMILGRRFYPHYQHHRPIRFWGVFPWLRSARRHWFYRFTERRFLTREIGIDKPFFLMPLQVWYDSQIQVHSPFATMEEFITHVVGSFARSAAGDTHLVIKQHPMDRGETCYRDFIRQIAAAAGCGDRVHYIHDQHLPTLIKRARGVVSINSTVAFSALCHGTPVKLLGRAVFDIPGITSQASLDQFWADPGSIDRERLLAFRELLL